MASQVAYDLLRVAGTKVLPAIFLNQGLFFIGYKMTGNHCIVDPAWAMGQFMAGATYALHFGTINTRPGQLILGLLGLWAVRLGGFLFYHRVYKGHLDERYELMLKKRSIYQGNRDYLAYVQFTLQAILMAITTIPLYFVFQNPSFSVKNVACMGLILAGIGFQALADQQLQNFKEAKMRGERNESLFREGLFTNSRHPNLFFELVIWWSLAAYGFTGITSAITFIGPSFLFFVMDALTVPLTVHVMKRKRGEEFDRYVAETNRYWPF